jgi:hypothetical protein
VKRLYCIVTLFLFMHAPIGLAAELKIILPLARTAYQTNESIDVVIVRTGDKLDVGKLELTLTGTDGGKITSDFPVKSANNRRVEHLRLDARLIRPGVYTLAAACDGATANLSIDVESHLRRSTFKLIDWGSRAKGEEQALLGEKSLGFNLNYAAYGGIDADAMIRGHIDYMRNCTMSGAHQMDLRQECDWSDPYVLQGGEARVVREALIARRNPNALGVHFYDEPGLTWLKDPKTGIMTPYNLPATDRSYRSYIGADPINYKDVRPDDPAAVEKWNAMNRWKLSVLDAAWKYAQFGVSEVDPKLLSVTQSAYGFSAYADGYYFNVARSLPVLSTHGGYDDFGAGYWNPALTFEMGRMRDYSKPNWYLATWNGKMPPNLYRMETWLCFMRNMQGIAKPPDAQIHKPQSMGEAAEGILEVNCIAERLGTVFTTMPVDKGDVAMLYSLSTILNGQVHDMQNAKDLNKSAYEGGGHSRDRIMLAYEAGKQIHQNLFPIVEEDILDGTASTFKAIFLPGVNALEPRVIAALEAYITGGGVVIVSDDSQVKINGATKLGYAMTSESMDKARQLYNEKKEKEFFALETTNYYWKAAEPTAKALEARLAEKNIHAPFKASSGEVVTSRQAYGDVEYLFAVNTTFDENEGKRNSIKGAKATLTLAGDGRPVYDAIHGGVPAFLEKAAKQQPIQFDYSFGAGQMLALARTARPIGGVQIPSPIVERNFTSAGQPIKVRLSAAVVDVNKMVLAGSIPLRIRVTDPLGVIRFEGYRATDRGGWNMDVPLAANDPAGDWQVTVTELLANNVSETTFKYQPAATCGAVAGAQSDAVCFAPDRDNIFRFFRTHRDVTIVTGASDFNTAAAQRIAEILKPWDVKCTIVSAKEASQPRQVEASAQPTWVGLEPGRIGPSKDNPKGVLHPNQVGFNVRGATLVLGTPDDNPIIKFAAEKGFLPYTPDKLNYPGPDRAMIAWQRDLVSYQSESVTLIAYDAAGMNQAVGSLYQIAAAIDPLMALAPAAPVTIVPASKNAGHREEVVAWRTVLPDRPVSMVAADGKIVVTSTDGTATTLDANGKIVAQKSVDVPLAAAWAPVKPPKELSKALLPHHIVKTILGSQSQVAVAYWGGAIQIFDPQGNLQSEQQLANDPIELLWNNKQLVVAQSDGSVIALGAR